MRHLGQGICDCDLLYHVWLLETRAITGFPAISAGKAPCSGVVRDPTIP